jgi:NAD(P)-dependent dehydrogenase (short-subunit alcohol dehydrogenase family)
VEDGMANFTWQSTTDEVLAGIDLKGKRALVTGVSAGLGVETSRVLLEHGAEVVGTARDLKKAREATKDLTAKFGDKFALVEVDLASLASVRKGADAIRALGKPFDLVIANAGIMCPPFGRTADGFELQFGTNHLGHFVLVNRIADLMRAGARLVNLSSSAHHFGELDFDDPNYQRRPYEANEAYAASKIANILFTVEFDRRHKGRGVRAAAVHPGNIMTELMRYMSQEALQSLTATAMADMGTTDFSDIRIKTIPQGAATSVWAGVAAPADLVGGRYCEDCNVGPTTPKGGAGVRPTAMDPERAKTLWAKSEELVGETFN